MDRLLRFWPWAALALMAACILAMNIWCVPAFDELMYAFEGLRTPMNGDIPSPRIATLADIVRQQWGDYFHPGANGRVFLHGMVALFAGFRLYLLFDAINTAMWFLLVWLVLREAHVPLRRDGKTFLVGALTLWWCLWIAETCSMNAAFAVNYLWTACATVVMMALWRRAHAWWWVPVAFFYGWSHEAFALPMLAALAGGVCLRSIAERRLALTTQQAVAWMLMLAGACFLCFAPATRGRAGDQVAFLGGMTFLQKTMHAHISVFLLLGTLTLALGLAWALWRHRSHLRELFLSNVEWILFLLAAEVLFTVLTGTGNMGLRMAMPMLLAGCILLFRLRDAFVLSPFVKRILLSTIALWAGGGVAIQIKAGEEIMSMLKIYAEDVRGVAPLPPMRLWGWMYSSYRSYLNGQDRMCFRRELGHSTPLTVLTPWLYETLYRNPERFFTKATRLGESGLYVAQQVPSVVVKRGEKVLNPAEDEALRVYRATYQKRQEEGIERFLPGRFRAMVPPAESVLALPAEGKTIEAMDGHLYTLFPVKGTL